MFAAHGLVLGAWVTQVPVLRDRLHLGPAWLGAALFCISAGALSTMPLTSFLVRRFGMRTVIRGGSLAACVALPGAVWAPGYGWLCLALLGFGAGFGTVDVAMNAESVRVERAAGAHILGSVHALWSVGSAAGSVAGAALLALAGPGMAAACLAGVAGCVTLTACGWLGVGEGCETFRAAGVRRPWRDSRLLMIGGVLCAAFATEGAVADWGGVFLRSERGVPVAYAGLGYGAFSCAMIVLRFAGDGLRRRAGDAGVLLGAFAAVPGVALVVLTGSPVLAVAGFGLVGLGVANVVPALFALAGARAANADAAIGVVSTLGYAGVLAGPPIFGAVAQVTSLGWAVAMVGGLGVLVGVAGWRWRGG